ncbi:FecR domain-containing protein [Hymenobacter sp. UYP22]|uniref:FecR family protein n=1 Tax=Hymenobacter sp. UYP22 TaxID=3156348 RepID=UPI0033988535
MAPTPTPDTFFRYVEGSTSPAESAAVRAWLCEPANQLLARVWMEEHWNTVDIRPNSLIPEPDYEAMLGGLHQRLGLPPHLQLVPAEEEPQEVSRSSRWRYWAAAAATAGIMALSGSVYWQYRQPAAPAAYATTFGQTSVLHLPDGTDVTLNGNSTIRYAVEASDDKPREVWLNGEAYFSVRHLPTNQRFVVHTDGGMNVEVLGTKFTVFRRRQESRVVLLSGKVRVAFADASRPAVVMKPGELVETQDAKTAAVVHVPVQTDTYAAWKDAKLVLNNTSITDLATRLHDTYGLQVTIASPSLNERRMTGTVPVRDLDLLLRSLEETFHLKIDRQDDHLTLSDPSAR